VRIPRTRLPALSTRTRLTVSQLSVFFPLHVRENFRPARACVQHARQPRRFLALDHFPAPAA
jgi:hypothetical protein